MADQIVVLLIEDEQPVADVIIKTIRDKVPGIRVEHEKDFANAENRIKSLSPDIIVLDIYEGDPIQENAAAGLPVWAKTWRERFCPLIFHTARELPGDAPPQNHPFVKFVRKKYQSDLQVAAHLNEFLPHMNALRAVEREVFGVLQSVLKEVAAILWHETDDAHARERKLIRAARRRAAAMMDEATVLDGKPMTNWEQYLIPPLGENVLMGDVLHTVNTDENDPATYRLVLTPSCDMVKGRKRCVPQVLVARCSPISNYITGASLVGAKEKTLKERLPILLTQEECGGFVALPPLPGVFPVMAAGMRDLEIIPFGAISNGPVEGAQYLRVVSVDSPFREKLAWAYLQIASRPGMPDCDSNEFIEAIVKAVAAGSEKKS